jgi:hypothetical protein
VDSINEQADQKPEPGLACLSLLLAFHQIPSDISQLRHAAGAADTIQSSDLVRLARRLGAKATARKVSIDKVGQLPLPVIAAAKDGGFFLVGGIRDGMVLVQPHEGSPETIDLATLESRWSSEVVLITTRGCRRARQVRRYVVHPRACQISRFDRGGAGSLAGAATLRAGDAFDLSGRDRQGARPQGHHHADSGYPESALGRLMPAWTGWPPQSKLSFYWRGAALLLRRDGKRIDLSDTCMWFWRRSQRTVEMKLSSLSPKWERWDEKSLALMEENIRYDLGEDGFRVIIKRIAGAGQPCSTEMCWKLVIRVKRS